MPGSVEIEEACGFGGDHCLAPARAVDAPLERRGTVRAAVRRPAAARGRRRGAARPGPRRRRLRRRRVLRRRARDRGRVAPLRAVHRPRHHRRPLAASAARRALGRGQLPQPARRPRVPLRIGPDREPVPLPPRRSRPAPARAERPWRGGRRAAKRRGRCADRRPAKRRPHRRLAAAGGDDQAPQPARRARARARCHRRRRLRDGPPRDDLALPVGDRQRLPAAPRRRRDRSLLSSSTARASIARTAHPGSRSSSPTQPSATATARSATLSSFAAAPHRCGCSPT